jgi:hypothetical protein
MQVLKKVSKLIVFIGETELQTEFARQKLCKCNAFEPYAAFQRLDRQAKGYIISKDVEKYMK